MFDGRDLDGDCVAESCLTDVQCTAPKDSHCFAMGETSAKFSFTRVFPPSAGQAAVFEHSTRPLLDEAFNRGQNALIFAYGLTNSGKTYTMLGKEGQEEQGIIPRLIRAVIDRLNAADGGEDDAVSGASTGALGSPTSSAAVRPAVLSVVVSFLEIYNEKVLDLLSKDRRVKCEIQATAGDDGEVFVKGLREVEVRGVDDAFALLKVGQAARAKARTALNADSSRSHSVFCVKLVDADGRVWSRMSIVDLAGSERSDRTKTESGDERRKEASSINNSLVTLGRCLEVLRNNSRRKVKEMVPFRESALTRLFKDSLTGSGRTVMMVNVSQVHADYDETLHALRYASIAREVTMVAKVDSRNDVAALKRKHKANKMAMEKATTSRMQRLHEEEEKEEGEEEDGEMADDGDVEGDSEASEVDVLLDDDESAPVRVHAAELVDSREEEVMDALNEVHSLKQQLVALHMEASINEQRIRDELTEVMDGEAAAAEELSNRRVLEERERVTAHLTRRFEQTRQRMDDTQRELEDRICVQEERLSASERQLRDAEQRLGDESARVAELQEQLSQAQQQKEIAAAEVQRLESELSKSEERVHTAERELLALRVSFDAEKASLLAEVAAGSAALAALQAEVDAEREEQAWREKKERKEAEEKEKQREKELKAERKEADKARKEGEKEKAKLVKELDALKKEAVEEQTRLQCDKEEALRQAADERAVAVASFAEERSAWKAEQEAERAQQLRALERVKAEMDSEREKRDQALAALSAEHDGRMQAAGEARQAEVAKLTLRIEQLTERVQRLTVKSADVEAARAAEAAERAALDAQRSEEDGRREEERKRRQAELDELAPFVLLQAEYNSHHADALASRPDFLRLLRSLLFPTPKPTLAPPPLPTAALPAAKAPLASVTTGVAISSFQAPPILPAGSAAAISSSAASSATAPSPHKAGILKKPAAVSKRDSMDTYLEGYDERLVQATLSHTSAAAASSTSSSSLVRRGKERLSSALDALRFNATRTAPASSLHHALNESRSVSLVSAAPLAAQQMAKGAVQQDGALLSPKLQRVLSRSRRSRSKSRKGKENQQSDQEDAPHRDGSHGANSQQQPPSSSNSSKSSSRKAPPVSAATAPPSSTAQAALPAPLSDAVQFDRLLAAESAHAKYGRMGQQPPALPAAAELLKPKMPTQQPTPVAKRTRQHTSSK